MNPSVLTNPPPASGFADDDLCDTFDDLARRAADHGYLLTVWPTTHPHQAPVEVHAAAACIHVFEPESPTRTNDIHTLNILKRVIAGIESASV